MESFISANRLIDKVNDYEIWIPDESRITVWESKYGGTFATCDCDPDRLLPYLSAAIENDPPLGSFTLMVPIITPEGASFRLLRNAESIKRAGASSDQKFPFLLLQPYP